MQEKKPAQIKQQVISAQASMSSGPLPQSQEFKRYNEVLPGSADRILKMAETEQSHRINLQIKELQHRIDNDLAVKQINLKSISATLFENSLRIVCALMLCLVIVFVGAYAIFKGYPGYGATIITGTVVSIIIAFITGKFKKDS